MKTEDKLALLIEKRGELPVPLLMGFFSGDQRIDAR